MRKYGLPLGVVAGLALAAALGAVAGARWARHQGGPAPAVDGIAAIDAPAPGANGPGRVAPPRFLTPGGEEPTEATEVTRHHRDHAISRAPEAAPGPAGPRAEASAEGPPPSPAAIARAREVRAALESAVAAHPGTRVRFADCSTGTCVARVESTEAAPIDRLIADRQRLPPGFTARAHERLTAFNGRIWELELVEEKTR
jgi:hypothetical protein